MQGGKAAREQRLGFACAFLVLFIWSGFILASRGGATGVLTPWDLAALRHVVSFAVLAPFAGGGVLGRLSSRRAVALAGFAGLGFPLCAYAGFALAPAAHGAVLLPGALPFATALVARLWLGERVGRERALSLAIVLAGIALIAGADFFAASGAWRGDFLFLAGTTSWAVFTLLVRHLGVTALEATVAVGTVSAPLYLPVWALALPSRLDDAAWGEIAFQGAYQGGLAMVVASLLYTRALVALGPTRLAFFTSVVLALAAVAAWPILGEPLGPLASVGVVLVTAGMLFGVLRGSGRTPAR
ncbi:DMT family transporter [Elioraea tepida]|uniref:DMT family transporter n=1 Tax=Elioraea tepida TaxID=2843330 RepID=A0A975U2B6_9PROT|nr:DMT family transporter [Elioraea tepida]QXM24078.1 DMT family transporter [Elioraea tepida]